MNECSFYQSEEFPTCKLIKANQVFDSSIKSDSGPTIFRAIVLFDGDYSALSHLTIELIFSHAIVEDLGFITVRLITESWLVKYEPFNDDPLDGGFQKD